MELRARTPAGAVKRSARTGASPPPSASGRRASAAASPAPSKSPRAGKPTRAASGDHGAHHGYEFGGPPGALAVIVLLPIVCHLLVRLCHPGGCLRLRPTVWVPPALPWSAYYTPLLGSLLYLVWFGLCVALHTLLPGARVQGTLLRDGSRLTYKLNGMRVLLATSALWAASVFSGVLEPAQVHTHFLPLLTGAIVFAFALSGYLFLSSYRPGRLLAVGGDTRSGVYNFFIGRELNPRLGTLDLKQFCELQPGLILWLLLDWSFAAAQYAQEGRVRPSMLLVCLFQSLYIFDALACESAILTTMDITTDGFGFMLAFGDLVWVPFTYCLQARYLLEHPVALSPAALVCIVALQGVGYAVFRGANSQKDAFRRDPTHPSVAHLQSMATQRGTRLIISGWWGRARHINYFGDWLMAWAWCLPCGFNSVIPYFYVVYFGVLLLHRERRDEEACRAKYGADWERYCELVPWRIIPYVY